MHTGLIVDDAAIMRVRLREILEPEFQVVAEAGNGNEALSLYEETKPDFVTLDITMPQLNGIAALKSLLAANPGARVVIVSAVGQKQIVFDAISIGAKDFIIKPFDPERVLKSVRRLFE
jgi:two-component system, chemotaxis family, chemotaxis protein CheY